MERAGQRFTENGGRVSLPILAAIVLAPLLFGGTTVRGELLLDGLCFLGLLLCVAGFLSRRPAPGLPKTFWIPLAGLVLLGALHVAFPHFSFKAETWSFVPVEGAVPWLPGSVDRQASLEAFRHFLALAAAALVLAAAARDREARWWILRAIGVSGLVVALVGIAQKASGAGQMLWSTPEESGHLFFGAFRYHGNAAAFLNLCWPASLALWLRHRQDKRAGAGSSLWMVAFIVTLAGVFVNSSKAGHVVAAIFLVVAAIRFRRHFPLRGRGWATPAAGVLVLLLFAAVAVGPGMATSLEKWDEVVSDGSTWKGRLAAYRVCLGMLPDSGPWGTGPGTFRLVFPFYTAEAGGELGGFWYHAHQDYLQAWIEWGAVGFVLFGVVAVGGVFRAVGIVRRARGKGKVEISTSCALIGFGTVAMHALVDFPLQIPAIQIPAVAFLAFFWARRAVRRPAHHAPTKNARRKAGVERARRDLECV